MAVVVVAAGAGTYGVFAGWIGQHSGAQPDPSASGAVTYDAARTAAMAAANGSFESGSWNVVFAGAIIAPAALDVSSLAITKANDSCRYDLLPGVSVPAEFTIPGFSGSPDSGESPFWGLLLDDGTGSLLLVVVLSGVAEDVAFFAASQCPTLTAELADDSPIPPDSVDSSSVASAVQSDGGAAFMESWSPTVVELTTFGVSPGSSSEPVWDVSYSTCPPSGSTGVPPTGTQWDQSWYVESSTGEVILKTPATSESCSSAVGPFTIEFGSGATSSIGATNYDTLGMVVTPGLTTSMFEIRLTEPTDTVLPPGSNPSGTGSGCNDSEVGLPPYGNFSACLASMGPGWYAVLTNSTGVVYAIYDASGWHEASVVAPPLVQSADLLVLVSQSVLAGSAVTLTTYSTGADSVTGSTVL